MKSSSTTVGVLLPIYAAFVSLGLPDGILGAAWPQMRAHFAVELNANWPMSILGTCGAFLSSSLYWSSLTVGRFLIGVLSHRTTPVRILRAAVVLAGTGLGLSPIFPMAMHDTPRSVGQGHALNLIGFQTGSGRGAPAPLRAIRTEKRCGAG